MNLKGYQRSYLTRFAHDLQPRVWIGKDGLSENVIKEINKALEDHEIIKVKFVDWKTERKALAEQVAERLQATLVRVIGNIAIIYRHQVDNEKRVVHLPK
jgi:RNA-binding protein